MEKDKKIDSPIVIQESELKGEKIIFDLLIKEKLKHVIVIKDGAHYHVNIDAEDLGSFTKETDGKINIHGQPRGAAHDVEDYIKAVKDKLDELNK